MSQSSLQGHKLLLEVTTSQSSLWPHHLPNVWQEGILTPPLFFGIPLVWDFFLLVDILSNMLSNFTALEQNVLCSPFTEEVPHLLYLIKHRAEG